MREFAVTVLLLVAAGCKPVPPGPFVPVPPAPEGLGTLRDATVIRESSIPRDAKRCEEVLRDAWLRFVSNCPQSMPKRDCVILAGRLFKPRIDACERLR